MTVIARPLVGADGEVPSISHLNGESLKTKTPATNGIPAVNGNGISPATAHTNGDVLDPFSLNQQYAYTSRKLKVITIGAGFSGLILAHKFQHRFPEMQDIIENTIYEARSDIGGTWLVNHYPGVQCDVPAHIYVRLTLIHLLNSYLTPLTGIPI
jgi:hypothetical protein